MTKHQIEAIKALKPWSNVSFHGNRKYYNGIPVEEVKKIVEKKRMREATHLSEATNAPAAIIRDLLKDAKRAAGTSYFKILIEGNTGIYYASPIFLHSDYNKSRIFDKSPETLRLMNIFNKIVQKY